MPSQIHKQSPYREEERSDARTHLYDFQVRKSPLRNICQVDDDAAGPFLQIPTVSNNKEKPMFNHPYAM